MWEGTTRIEFDQRLGLLLRLFREQRGLTRRQLADFLGPPISEQDLHDYEFGVVSIPTYLLGRLSRTLNVPLAILLIDFSLEDLAEWHFFQNYLQLVPSTRRHVRRIVAQFLSDLAAIS